MSPALVSSRNEGLALLSKLLLDHDKGVNRLQVARLLCLIPPVFLQQIRLGVAARPLGFDRLLLFLQPQVKSSSVILAANCLVLLLSVPNLLARFREGVTTAGANGWSRSRDVLFVLAAQQQQQQQSNAASTGSLRRVNRRDERLLLPCWPRRKSTAAADGQ